MTEKITYTTRGVCSRAIEITVEDDIVTDIRFIGGCSGNTCPDQLATALEEYLSKKNA